MKKVIAVISSMLLASRIFAAQSVMVDTNGLVSWPLNFFATNGVTTSSATTALAGRTTVLEAQVIVLSNANVTTTGSLTSVAGRVTVLETNTASKAQGIIATNAQAQITALSAIAVTQVAGCITATGTITALHFVGDGSGLTGVVSVVTGGVNHVTVGGSNLTGNIVLNGTGVTLSGPGTATVSQVEYITKNIVPTTNIWDITLEGPRDENFTLKKIWCKADLYNCTFSLITCTTNSGWRDIPTVLTAGIIAPSVGMMITTNVVIPSNTLWGIKVTDLDPRCNNLIITYKGTY